MAKQFFLVLCLLLSSWSYGQDPRLIDSLEAIVVANPEPDTPHMRALQYLWHYTVSNDLDKASEYAQRILADGRASGKDYFTVFGYRAIGTTYDYQGRTDSAVHYYHIARDMYRALGKTDQEAAILFNLALTHRDAGQLDSAKTYLQLADTAFIQAELPAERASVIALTSALERDLENIETALLLATQAYTLAQEADDSTLMADINQEIGLAHEALKDYETAIDYFQRNAHFYRRNHNDYFYAVSLIQITGALWELDRYEEGRDYAEKAIDIAGEYGYGNLQTEARTYLAGIFIDQENYEEAIKVYRQLEPSLKGPYDERQRAVVLLEWARAEVALKQFGSARAHAQESVEICERNGYLHNLTKAREHLGAAHAGLGNYAAAYEQAEKRRLLKDSLQAANLEANLAEFTAKFEKERQDRLISEQKTKLTLLENQAQIDRLQKSLLWLGLLGAVLVFGVIAYSLRQRVARQRIEKAALADKVKGQQRELSAHALQMGQKSRLLDQLSAELSNIKGERPDDRKKLNSVLRELSSEERIDNDWHNFRTYFQGVHGDFEDRLKAIADQKLSPRELRMAALIKMQLNNQEIGTILGVSQDSLYKAKYRLRKKFSQAEEGALDTFIAEI